MYLSFLLPDEASGRNVVKSAVCCSLNSYTSILFVLHKCLNFFYVAHFGAAIVSLSARLGAAFGWSTYVCPLSHLSFLCFVTFVFFTLRCQLFFIFRCHLFLFINSCAFSNYLSFLLPDEARWRNVVNSTVRCCSVCLSLNYYTSILFVLHKCRNFFSVAHFGASIVVFSARFGAAFRCFNFAFCWSTYARLLAHLSFTGFCHFRIFQTAISAILLFPLSHFFFINPCVFSY